MDKTLNDINEISHAKGSIEELVNNTDIADIKAFLIDLLKDDPMLLQQFKFIFIEMKKRVNKNRCKVQNIGVNMRGSPL